MDIPTNLKDLLLREAHLKASRDAITPALQEQEVNLARLQEHKPGLFTSKAQREEYQLELGETLEALQLLRRGIGQLERVEKHIRRLLLEAGENQLREAHPDYLRALAIRESRTDWANCLKRFGEKVHNLTQALGNVRNMVCSGYKSDQQVYSQGAVQAFMLAINAGKQVEDEVKFANRIAEMQEKLLAETGLHAVPLPRLREVSYSQWVALISNMSLVEAQQQFDQIIAESKQISQDGLPELRYQTELATANQEEALQGYVESYLDEMRFFALLEVNPDETEASVADSERMLEDLARNSVLGRLPGN